MPNGSQVWLTNVGLRYRRSKVWALKDVNIEKASGAIAVLGPNGAGKTSLFRVLTTTLRPTTGSFGFGSVVSDTPGSSEVMRRNLGYLPQGFRAFGGYTCEEFMTYVAWLRHVHPREAGVRITEALDVVDLSSRSKQKVRSLSGGMRQRLGLAQALVSSPELLLLDEPTVGLDPEQRATFMSYLSAIANNTTVVLATHLVEDVAVFATSAIILHEGNLAYQGTLQALCDQVDGVKLSGADVEAAYLRVVARRDPG